MKLVEVKEIEAVNPEIKIILNPETSEFCIVFSYQCQRCVGKGCGKHNQYDCQNGKIYKLLKPDEFSNIFSAKEITKIKTLLNAIYLGLE